jgi:HK97 gp10 family phage protein
MQIDIQEEGFIKLTSKLKKGTRESVARGITRVTQFMERETRRNITESVYNRSVPWRRSGKARQSIVGQSVDDMTGKVFVGVNYARFIEYGTRPHQIRAKNARVLAGDGRVFGRVVNHPGSKAYPFWRPAVKTTQTEAPKIMQKEIRKDLSK